jgi:hypothetical protein
VKLPRSALYTLSTLLLTASLAASWAIPSGASVAPKQLTGHLLVRTDGREAFGSLVTHAMLNGGSIRDKVIINGKYGYALATVGIYQYPVSTHDDGEQWRIAGGYFNVVTSSVMGAGGTATNIAMLSRRVAVAFRDGDIEGPTSNIYVTTDSGRHWYVTSLPGTVQGVGSVLGGPNNSTLKALFESVHSLSPPGAIHRYESVDAGRSWLLL